MVHLTVHLLLINVFQIIYDCISILLITNGECVETINCTLGKIVVNNPNIFSVKLNADVFLFHLSKQYPV